MFRKLIHTAITIMLGITVTACGKIADTNPSSLTPSEIDGYGSLIISINDLPDRNIFPDIDLTPDTYVITGYGPADSKFTRTVSAWAPSAAIERLVFGKWTVTVEALNSSNILIAGGQTEVYVRAGETESCVIIVEPLKGEGTLSLTIDWDDIADEYTGLNPYLEITLTRSGYESFSINYELDKTLGRAYVNEALDSGYYTLNITLYDETGDIEARVGGKVDLVRIVEGQETSAFVSLTKWAPYQDPDLDKQDFPTPEEPAGSDAVSSSTNQSGKSGATAPALSPLAGAAFIKPPDVNNYGAVTLRYNIDVPAGRAAMKPSIDISYSTSAGDGILGTGWTLGTGLGMITRVITNGQLYYDHRDTFAFNGSRLVKVSGPEKSEAGIYRLEIESTFSRFELTDAGNGGVWRVYDRNGTITIYGEDRSSRIYHPENNNLTYTWSFSRAYDTNGNFMYAVYDASDYGEYHIHYLKEIRYTGNYNKSVKAAQFIRLKYKKRNDNYVSKAPGFIVKMDRLLYRIEAGWDDPRERIWGGTEKILRTYNMVYEYSPDTGRPFLKTVDADRYTTRPEFFYQNADNYFTWQTVSNPNYNSNTDLSAVKYFSGDFNGDGLSDMVFFNPGTGLWKASQGSRDGNYTFPTYGNKFRGHDSDEKIQFFKNGAVGDYNGDARSDIAFYLPETREFWVAEHNGQTFNFKNYGRLAVSGLDIFKCEWFTGDFDGNGLSDVVLFNEAAGDWIYMANTGGGFSFIKFAENFKNLFRYDYSPNSNMDSDFTSDASDYGTDRGKVQFFQGDYNGDGRTDISFYDSRDGKWWVAENYRSPLNPPEGDLQFILQWRLYKEFNLREQALFQHERFSGDFNGDGFSDFLVFDRETDEWILGETGDGNINFRDFSRLPKHKVITRWLQGDFNGDGRTDIGFYSETDNNFWIGEATPDGFNYKIYSSLKYGPDPGRVMSTPLPEDEIKIVKGTAAVPGALQSTTILNYSYDGNYYPEKGEKAFAGNFAGEAGLLVYRRNDVKNLKSGWSFHAAGGERQEIVSAAFSAFDPDDPDTHILNNGKPLRYCEGKDGILWYKEEAGYSVFGLARNEGGGWVNDAIGSFDAGSLPGFSIDDNRYYVDDFTGEAPYEKKSVLVFNKENGTPYFLVSDSPETRIEIFYRTNSSFPGDPYSAAPAAFRNALTGTASVSFSGKFTAGADEPAQILLVYTGSAPHRWYLGTLDVADSAITFTEISYISGNANFVKTGYTGSYHVSDGKLIYSTSNAANVRFHAVTFLSEDSIETISYGALAAEASFDDEYDHCGNPIVHIENHHNYFDITEGALREINPDQNSGFITADLTREDLTENYYAYRWLEGDFNGDGNVDIGFFSLGDPKWYFAQTKGNRPGLLTAVNNGIGGAYKIEYMNSADVDNTGGDGIPDLALNFKLCSKITMQDGFGNEFPTRFEYKNGYAYNAFINGKREADFFGFSEFHTINTLGGRNIKKFNTTPYSDYRKNRALSGAIKEVRFVGEDGVEYSRVEYDYKIHDIIPSGLNTAKSYMIEPVETRSYNHGVLTSTKRSATVLAPRGYRILSKEDSVTDHYSDEIHSPETVKSRYEYNYIEETNEIRLSRETVLPGTVYENTTSYTYDNRGNCTEKETEYTGFGLEPADPIIIKYEYDSFGNKIKTTNLSGSPSRSEERSFEDESGLYQFVTESRVWTGERYLKSKYKIDYGRSFGTLVSSTDPSGNSVYFEFDDYGRVIRQKADTDYGDKRTLNEYAYNSDFPLSAKVTQYTGTIDEEIETRVYIDGLGRGLHTIKSAGPNKLNRKYTKSGAVVYDPLGRVIRQSQATWAQDDEINIYRPHTAEKHPTVYRYDAVGRPQKVTSPAAGPGEPETSVAYFYNDPYEVTTTHSIGRGKTTVVNGRGQALYVEDFGTGDDGEYVHAKIGFAYDIAGNKVKKMDLPPPASGHLPLDEGEGVTMDLTIDEALFRPGEKDDSGYNICQWKYDGFGRLIAGSDADLGYAAVEYNAFGDVTRRTDAMGRTTHFKYDDIGRPVKKTLPGDEGSIIYKYDIHGQSANSLGKLVEIEDPVQKKIFSYDKFGRVKREIREIQGTGYDIPGTTGTFVTSFEHDLLSRTRTIYYPADPVTGVSIMARYRFSASGVTSVEAHNPAGKKAIISSVLYNEFGQPAEVTRGNGTETIYDYDIRGRLTNLVTTTGPASNQKTIQDIIYKFNIDNNIKSTVNTPEMDIDGAYSSSTNFNYSYDGLNRLKRAEGLYQKPAGAAGGPVSRQFEREFVYAANGNLLRKIMNSTEQTGTENKTEYDEWNYNYANHAVTAIDTVYGNSRFEMLYDETGNMLRQRDNKNDTTKNMTYDSASRITRVTDKDNNEIGRYWYDNQGFRVRKIAKPPKSPGGGLAEGDFVEVLYPSMYFGLETRWTQDGQPVEGASYAVNHIYLGGVRVAAVLPSGKARYYLTDQVDSVNIVVDDSGRPVTKTEFLPYGETWFEEGNNSNAPKYNSQELDRETGYYFYNARHYDPQICRFVTPDTVIDGALSTQGWNRYSYVRNNPVGFKDPSGNIGIPNISVSSSGASIGVSNILGSPFGCGITFGWTNGGYAGAYGEVGYAAYARVGANYQFKSKETVGYVSGQVGIGNLSANSTMNYNLTRGKYMGSEVGVGAKASYVNAGVTWHFNEHGGYTGRSYSAGIGYGSEDGKSSVGAGVGYRDGAWSWSVSGKLDMRGEAVNTNPAPAPVEETEPIIDLTYEEKVKLFTDYVRDYILDDAAGRNNEKKGVPGGYSQTGTRNDCSWRVAETLGLDSGNFSTSNAKDFLTETTYDPDKIQILNYEGFHMGYTYQGNVYDMTSSGFNDGTVTVEQYKDSYGSNFKIYTHQKLNDL